MNKVLQQTYITLSERLGFNTSSNQLINFINVHIDWFPEFLFIILSLDILLLDL